MKADFKKRYGGGKADTATAKSLNKDFGYVNLRNILEDDILISLCIWMRICWKKLLMTIPRLLMIQTNYERAHAVYHWPCWRDRKTVKSEGSSFWS